MNMISSPSHTSFSPWPCLDSLAGQGAVPAVWQRKLGEHFKNFRPFLHARLDFAAGYPCDNCGCNHEIVLSSPRLGRAPTPLYLEASSIDSCGRSTFDSSRRQIPFATAVCRCEPWRCDDIVLTAAEVQLLELDWSSLGRALCKALGLDQRPVRLSLSGTRQIGSWSAAAVPVILTLPRERDQLSTITDQLTSRLRRPCILLTPTTVFWDASSLEPLVQAGSEIFALEAVVRLTGPGVFDPVKSPGELFTRFRPEVKETPDEDLARRAFALVKTLDTGPRLKPPTILTVFRLYCMEGLSTIEIARQCRASKTAILRRLALIQKRTGIPPQALRRFSNHFNQIEDSLADPRASHIHRKGLIDEDQADADG